MKIQDEQVFVIPEDSFSVGYTSNGYTLAYSVDGTNFTNHTESVPANEVCVVSGMSRGLFYKLVGNSGDALIQY